MTPDSSHTRRTLPSALPLLLTPGLMLVTVVAHAGGVLDFKAAGPVAAREDDLIVMILGLMLIVLVPVFVMTIGFAWRYRANNSRATYRPNWSSRGLDIVVWLVPAALVAVLTAMTWIYTHRLDPYMPIDTNLDPLKVQVVAQDWKWLFIYPRQHIATVNKLVIPANRPISFDITSDTVMNAFFIPQLGGQVYAMAGMRTELHLLADQPGTYYGENTQYSGRGFPFQHFEVVAKPEHDFDAWVSTVKQQGQVLDWGNYQALRKPAARAPVGYYTTVEDGLFDRIMAQYHKPDPGA